jgi:hypothetical protein
MMPDKLGATRGRGAAGRSLVPRHGAASSRAQASGLWAAIGSRSGLRGLTTVRELTARPGKCSKFSRAAASMGESVGAVLELRAHGDLNRSW